MRVYADHENAHFTWCILAGHFEEVAKLHYHWGGGQSCHFFFFFFWRGVCLRRGDISCPVAPGCSRHPRYLSLEQKKKARSHTRSLGVGEKTWFVCGCPASEHFDWWAAKAHRPMLISGGRLPGSEGCVGMSSPGKWSGVWLCLVGRKSLLMLRRRPSLSNLRHSRPHTHTSTHRPKQCGAALAVVHYCRKRSGVLLHGKALIGNRYLQLRRC